MRELEREPSQDDPSCRSLAIIGQGRLGNALAGALREAGWRIDGPLGRGASGDGGDAVLLCVPDQEIADAAALIPAGPLVGHCSGATGLAPLAGHAAFSLHPLMTVTESGASFEGAGAAIAGSTPRALQFASALATSLGLRAVEIADGDRPAYHAAASIASNFLVTLEAAAEQLVSSAGGDRDLLLPLVRATVENWAALGPERALTGPVARGDEATVAAQRSAVAERAPELLELFDALVKATRELGAGAGMKTHRTVDELRATLAPARRGEATIGLVPTMGALHEGHLSLMRHARKQCDLVVVSLFVNPTQFDELSDLDAYPRDEARDAALADAERVDHLFAPRAEEIYPDGFATTVSVAGITESLEGAHRGRGHFDGVTTVVAKLFTIVGPDKAFFGQKDAQQLSVIKRLVRDLDLSVEIVACPTVREADGLAMSSRNARLSREERERASALYRGLRAAEAAIAAGARVAAPVVAAALQELQEVELEYFELVDPETFVPIRGSIDRGDVLAVVAARVGATRLIDNHPIEVPTTGSDRPAGSTTTQEALACSAQC